MLKPRSGPPQLQSARGRHRPQHRMGCERHCEIAVPASTQTLTGCTLIVGL